MKNFQTDQATKRAWKNDKITNFAFGDNMTLYSRGWVKQTHRCPVCKKPYTDWQDIGFIEENGMCVNCEHAAADVEPVLADMAEVNGMSLESYKISLNL